MPSPLAHQTGFLYGMWLSWVLGVPEIVQRTWNATRALEVLNEWEGTFVQAATPFLTDLVREVEAGAEVPHALRVFVATGAAVPRALAERATRVLGATVCGAFGTTETGLAALASPSDPAAKAWGTDGKALHGVSLRIVDDDGHPVAAGQEGNFELTGPTVFDGYLERPDLSAEAFTADGWYRTGDLATLDDDGYLRITGRVRDVINRGGEKVPVSEIEASCCIGIPQWRMSRSWRCPTRAWASGPAHSQCSPRSEPDVRTAAEVPRRLPRRQELLAGAPRDRRRAAAQHRRQGAEVPAARAGGDTEAPAAGGRTPPRQGGHPR
ncbi:AMP-binding protein [Microbacterium elymi]|uniref:AMP-binding protein n=1 Tax=Microbacterium elymi TaxID=2909587 RepID=A0ABY5NIR4_9MICO|nr:AMP-binding protein [Microbacterium elymi]UUT35019.1 AMP-binding protein [Microbacterium elymi]